MKRYGGSRGRRALTPDPRKTFAADLAQEDNEELRAALIRVGVKQGFCDAEGNLIEERQPMTPNDEIRAAGRSVLTDRLRARYDAGGSGGEAQLPRVSMNEEIRRAHAESGPRNLHDWDTRRPL